MLHYCCVYLNFHTATKMLNCNLADRSPRCPALNGSEIKHISEMKADIKLCASSFSVVTLPASFMLCQGHLGACVWLSHIEESTGTDVYGEVKILMMLMNISMIPRRLV
jgi:hypothetical protein